MRRRSNIAMVVSKPFFSSVRFCEKNLSHAGTISIEDEEPRVSKPSSECLRLFAQKGGEKVYAALLKGLRSRMKKDLVFEDPKATCVHINAGENGTAYAGAHPRTGGVLLNIVTAAPLKSKRIRKAEQRSRNRCHCEVLLSTEADVDEELLDWLSDAAELVTQPKSKAESTRSANLNHP